MNFNNVSFPHPVLGVADDISSEINLVPEISSDKDDYIIVVDCKQNNTDLDQLLDEEKAEFICEGTCSNTLFREIVKSNSPKIEFKIPRKQVKGKVGFVCLLVSKYDIVSYSNADSHSDYAEYDFDIDEGEVLAYFGEFSFNADIRYEKLKAVSSFMDVDSKEDLSYTNIDLKKNKIEVQLPEEDFNVFSSDAIGKEPMLAPVFHASIVVNALLVALYNFEEHKDEYQWAKVIDYRMQHEEQFETLPIAERENIPEIAQRLLGNPFKRLLNGLEIILDSTENEE
jgi:hypothetical protein